MPSPRLVLAATAIVAWLLLAPPALASPQITSIVPSSGSALGGQQVTINGSGFLGAGATCAGGYDIWFGTDAQHGYAITPPSFKVLSDSQISVVTPANFGGTVDVRVVDHCGATPLAAGDRYTYSYPADQCVSGTCSVSVGSTQLGPLAHSALGVLDGFNTDAGVSIPFAEGDLVKALGLRNWRLGQSGLDEAWGGEFALAQNFGSQVSLDLTSDWVNWANGHDAANAWTPYDDLATYYDYIYGDVTARLAAGQAPAFYDVWNEPVQTGTVNQWLSVYGTAYRAIQAADPAAKVVGPSLAWPLLSSAGHPDLPGWDLSLSDFLNYEVSTGVRFAAVSYHEDGTTVDAAPNSSPGPWLPAEPVPGGYRDYWSPAAIARHAAAAKALIAGYPALSQTKLFVNEYGPTYAENEPGWMVGDIASLEAAGVDQAMLTCPSAAGCNSLLDGLIGADGAPQIPYWVMLDYSRQAGSRLQAAASGSNWYTLATQSTAADEIQALIGRADDCFGGQCPQFRASVHPLADAAVSVSVPWSVSSVSLSIQPLLNRARGQIGENDVPTAPASLGSTAPVHDGKASFTIPAVADGDAYYVTVIPSGANAFAGASTATGTAPVTAAQTSAGTAPPPSPGGARTKDGRPARSRGSAKMCSRRSARPTSRRQPRRCRRRTSARHATRRAKAPR